MTIYKMISQEALQRWLWAKLIVEDQ